MKKSLAAAAIVAACTVGGVLHARKSSSTFPDYGAINAQLYDPSPAVRKAAVSDMYMKGNLTSTRALLTVAREEDADVHSTLDHALLSTREKAAQEWLTTEGLTFPDRWTRYYAVRVLSAQKGAEAVPSLLPLLAENFWQVQIAILDAIAESGAVAQAADALAAASAPGKNWKVRTRAIRLLGDANSVAAAKGLLEKALPAAGAPTDPEAERAVEEALSRMTDAQALKVVAEGMGSPDVGRKLLSVKVLGRAKSVEAVGKLKEIGLDAGAPTPLRVAAIRAVVAAGGDDGIAFATGILDGGEAALRLEAAYALSEAELPPAAKEDMKARAAKEQDWRVKQALLIAGGV